MLWIWLKLAQWSWRISFLKFLNVFLLFSYYLPLEKDMELTWIPFSQECFVPSLDEIGPVGSNCPSGYGEKDEMWKVYDDDSGDNTQIWIRKAHISLRSGELKSLSTVDPQISGRISIRMIFVGNRFFKCYFVSFIRNSAFRIRTVCF